MLFDYLIAASLGFLGMLGMARLAGEMLLLHNLGNQLLAAELVLREVQRAALFLDVDDWTLREICNTDSMTALSHTICESVTPWLEYLPEHRLEQTASGQFRLMWRDTQGQWSSMSNPQIDPSPVTRGSSRSETDPGAKVSRIERL